MDHQTSRSDPKTEQPIQEKYPSIYLPRRTSSDPEKYPELKYIYSDGSKDGDRIGYADRVGCVAILDKTKMLCRLSEKMSFSSAEATAIYLALKLIESSRTDKFIIFSDSLSVLTGLKNKKMDSPLITKFINKITRSSVKLNYAQYRVISEFVETKKQI